MINLAIIGSGGHAKVILDSLIGNRSNLNVDNVFFACPYTHKNTIENFPVINKISHDEFHKRSITHFILGMGDLKHRIETLKLLKKFDIKPFNVIHKRSVISDKANIGNGVFLGPNCVVNCNTFIGDHAIINTGSIIEHDSKIGDMVFIAPNTTVLGGCTIKKNTFIGSGTVVCPKVTIKENCIIGANSTVLKNIESRTLAVGTPCNKVRNI